MNLIGRANKMSFWVASIIVWHRKLSDRVKVIDKFIRIAQVKFFGRGYFMGVLDEKSCSGIFF